MENKPKIKHFKIKLFSIITALLVCATGVSFAYFMLKAPTNVVNVSVDTGKINFYLDTLATANISSAKLDEKGDNKFQVRNNSTKGIKFDIYLTNISISNNLKSNDFKWKLYKGETKESEIANGTGSNFTSTEYKLTSSQQTLAQNSNATYVLEIWLANSDSVNQSNLFSGSFSGKIKVTARPQ